MELTSESQARHIEVAILRAFREGEDGSDPLGPTWLEEAVVEISALGSGGVVPLLATVISSFLILGGKPRLAVLLIVCATGSAVAMQLLKDLFERGRPDVVVPVYAARGLSFPSGHAMISASL